MDPLWASVFVTVVLVVITAYHSGQARRTIAEMERARKAELMARARDEKGGMKYIFSC